MLDTTRVLDNIGTSFLWFASREHVLSCMNQQVSRIRTQTSAWAPKAGGGGGRRDAGARDWKLGEACGNLLAVGALPPPTLDCQGRSFLFLFVFARELGYLPKNGGPKPGSF